MLKAVIIDDEENARRVLSALLQRYCPALKVVDSVHSIVLGEEAIKKHQPDVVFLDIEMPLGSGFDLLAKFPDSPFSVIFVTAHDNYVLRALRCSAVDYLLKPIIVEELVEAVGKIKPAPLQQNTNVQTLLTNKEKLSKIALPSKGGFVFRNLNEIIYCKADSNYTIFHLVDGEIIMASKTLKEFENLLEGTHFFRIHDSQIINTDHIEKYQPDKSSVLMKNGIELLVSRRRKKDFLELYYK